MDTGEIKQRWTQLDGGRGDLIKRCELYAAWTIPHLFQEPGRKDQESIQTLVPVGPRAVSHLANKIVTAAFPHDRPFFILDPTEDFKNKVREQYAEEEANEILQSLPTELALVEKRAMRLLRKRKHRPAAVYAAKLLIVTGNALVLHDGDKVQVYSVRDYVTQRDVAGVWVELITRDTKAFGTFDTETQDKLKQKSRDQMKPDTPVELLTRIKLQEDGRYKLTQEAQGVPLDTNRTITKDRLNYIVLTWNLSRGDDYGRGLVEDHAALFHTIDVLTQSLVEGYAAVADIKFLVNPASTLDIAELNSSRSGSYHAGRENDITVPRIDRRLEHAQIKEAVKDYEMQIAQSFLLTSGSVRDAERVTAEEIRYIANELETAYGGIYSQISAEWQDPTAAILLRNIDWNLSTGDDVQFEPVVTTGLESLSRVGKMENLRLFMSDLAMLNEIPEEFREAFDPLAYVEYVGVNRQVEYDKFMMTREQYEQLQQAKEAQAQRMMQAEAQAKLGVEAGKEMVKE